MIGKLPLMLLVAIMNIFMAVDKFSKTAHWIPLPELPSAKEEAEVTLFHFFSIRVFLRDVL